MVVIKVNNKFYVAYKSNEIGNPHPKKYPCLAELYDNEIKIANNQMGVLKQFFKENNLDYHDVIKYAEKDINTYDLVNAIIKFHDLKKI